MQLNDEITTWSIVIIGCIASKTVYVLSTKTEKVLYFYL